MLQIGGKQTPVTKKERVLVGLAYLIAIWLIVQYGDRVAQGIITALAGTLLR